MFDDWFFGDVELVCLYCFMLYVLFWFFGVWFVFVVIIVFFSFLLVFWKVFFGVLFLRFNFRCVFVDFFVF